MIAPVNDILELASASDDFWLPQPVRIDDSVVANTLYMVKVITNIWLKT